jgi:hypothetical protein
LAITGSFAYFLLKGYTTAKLDHFVFAALILSLGLLIKYTLLPLLVVLVVAVLIKRKIKEYWVSLIPFVVLALWSYWNIKEFGRPHLLGRPAGGTDIKQLWAVLSAIIAPFPFSLLFITAWVPKKPVEWVSLLAFGLFLIFIPLVYFEIVPEAVFTLRFAQVLIFFGVLFLVGLIGFSVKKLKDWKLFFSSYTFILVLIVFGFLSFIILFAPFSATRHLLLIFPFLLLLGADLWNKSSKPFKIGVISFTLFLGFANAYSDWHFADFYKRIANQIGPYDNKTYTIGHWGWQWYSTKIGHRPFATDSLHWYQKGDVLLIPKDIAKQVIPDRLILDTIEVLTEDPDWKTFISGKNTAAMYANYRYHPPFTLSNNPIDSIFIVKINEIKD